MSNVGLPAFGNKTIAESKQPWTYDVTPDISISFVYPGFDIHSDKLECSGRDVGPMDNLKSSPCASLRRDVLRVHLFPEDEVDTAGSIWYAGLALSNFLARNFASSVHGASVCELGAGCGVPGLVCGLIGATSVLLTDLCTNMEHINLIIEENKAIFDSKSCTISSGEIEFGSSSIFDCDSFDLVIGADIGFDLSLHAPIRTTLLNLCGKDTKIILCEEIRWKDVFDWYVEELQYSFEVNIVEGTPFLFCENGKRVALLILTKK